MPWIVTISRPLRCCPGAGLIRRIDAIGGRLEQLEALKGIGPKTLEELRPLVVVREQIETPAAVK